MPTYGMTGAVRAVNPRAHSVAETIYRALRDDILSLRLKPGAPLSKVGIERDFQVSPTPVREALLRLRADRLIETITANNIQVTLIPAAALPEAIVIRRALELKTVWYAARDAGETDIARLRANLEEQRRLAAETDHDGFYEADEAFHGLLAQAAGFPRFWEVTRKVKMQIDRCRRLALTALNPTERLVAEHEAVVDGIAKGDVDAAVAAMNAHFVSIERGVHHTVRLRPDCFDEELVPK